MSVAVMNWVFHHSQSRGTNRLVLLAIADSTNDQGCEAWPSLTTIGHKAGVDRRTVSRCIDRLEESGELERVRHGGRQGIGGTSNTYRIVMTTAEEWGQSATTKQGQSATRGTESLGAERPQVGAHSPKVGAESPPIHPIHPNHPLEKRATTKRGTQAPEEFPITEAMKAWADSKGITVDLLEQTEMFLDHHRAKGTVFRNWVAGWQKWIRQAQAWNRPSATPNRRLSHAEQMEQKLRASLERMDPTAAQRAIQ